MQKKREHVVVTEMVQVGCKWRLKGFFDHRHCRPKKNLLRKNQNQDVTGAEHQRGKSSALGSNLQGIKSAPKNKGEGIDDEINVPKLTQESDDMHKFALEILDSNNELFLKVLKDPNSLLVKRIRNARNLQQAKKETVKLLYENKLAECGNNAISIKSQKPTHHTNKSLLERIKLQYGCPSTDAEVPSTSNSIVLLKPRQTKHERDIFRKHRNLESSNRGTVGKKLNLPTVSSFNQRDIEAKKHLSEMLRNAENVEHFTDKQGPRTLKSILSSPFSSPVHEYSTASNQEKGMDASVCPQRIILPSCSNYEFARDDNSSPLQNSEVAASLTLMKLTGDSQIVRSTKEITEPAYSSDGLSYEAHVKNMEMNDTVISEGLDILEAAGAEQSSAFSECPIQDFWLESKPLNSSSVVSSSNPWTEHEVEIKDGCDGREEHPSPNFVLEALFTKDFTGLSSNINCSAISHTRPHHTDGKEASLVKDHIRALLQTTELHWEEFSKKSHPSVQLLNISSLVEHTLFLDLIKDILLELNQCHFDFYPRVPSISQNTLAPLVLAKNMMEEFMEEIQWYLVPPAMPRTLEDLAIKDTKKDDIWSGRKLETEEVVTQLTDCMLEELIMQSTYVGEK